MEALCLPSAASTSLSFCSPAEGSSCTVPCPTAGKRVTHCSHLPSFRNFAKASMTALRDSSVAISDGTTSVPNAVLAPVCRISLMSSRSQFLSALLVAPAVFYVFSEIVRDLMRDLIVVSGFGNRLFYFRARQIFEAWFYLRLSV